MSSSPPERQIETNARALFEAESIGDARQLMRWLWRACVNSRRVTGLCVDQTAKEDYICELLRHMYRQDKSLFDSADIAWLNSKPKARVQIHSGDVRPVAGHYYWDGPDLTNNSINASQFAKHQSKLEAILNTFGMLDVSSDPHECIANLAQQAASVHDQIVVRNYEKRRKDLGLPNRQLQSGNPRFRETHCYNCKGHLSSTSHLMCADCGWLVCTCGACGCGYGGG